MFLCTKLKRYGDIREIKLIYAEVTICVNYVKVKKSARKVTNKKLWDREGMRRWGGGGREIEWLKTYVR